MNLDDYLILLLWICAVLLFMIAGALLSDALLHWKERRAVKRLRNRRRNWK